MIKFFDTNEYREDVIELWQSSFGDERKFIEFFLDNCPKISVGYFIENRPVSMLFLLDGKIGKFSLKYIYAACTLESFRGRGYMAELISFVKDYCISVDCDGLFLVPGEESLYGYYSRFGFIDNFRRYEYAFQNEFSDSAVPEQKTFTADSVNNLRLSLLDLENSFVFSEKTAEYVISDFVFSGGKIYFGEENENRYLAFVSESNNKIEIKEYLSDKNVEMLKNIKHFINNNAENIYIRCPIVYNTIDKMVKCTKCGMSFPLTDEFRQASVNKVFYAGMYLD